VLARIARDRGASVTGDLAGADAVIVNSCAVTGRAARDVRKIVGRARRAAPGCVVVVTGCLVEVEDPATWDGLGVDARIGVADKMQAVDEALRRIAPRAARTGVRGAAAPPVAVFRPAVKVQEGCTVGCSYCIVPRTRGPERSVPAGDVVREIRAAGAVHEVVLTGTHLGAWGRDLSPPAGLTALVERVLDARAVRRLRLSSIEPWGVERGLVELVRGRTTGLCPHLHVPLQSGSPSIHSAMGRPGSPEDWRGIVEEVTGGRRTVTVGTDVIAGFPGEGPAEWRETLRMIERAPVSLLHVFSFSPRPGTRAVRLPGRVPEAEIKRRVAALIEIGRRKKAEALARRVGRELEVIVESERGGAVRGTSEGYHRVVVPDAPAGIRGRAIRAVACDVEDDHLVARHVEVLA